MLSLVRIDIKQTTKGSVRSNINYLFTINSIDLKLCFLQTHNNSVKNVKFGY